MVLYRGQDTRIPWRWCLVHLAGHEIARPVSWLALAVHGVRTIPGLRMPHTPLTTQRPSLVAHVSNHATAKLLPGHVMVTDTLVVQHRTSGHSVPCGMNVPPYAL